MAVKACNGSPLGVRGSRRIHYQRIARSQALKRRLFPMAELYETTFDAEPDVLARDNADPKLTRCSEHLCALTANVAGAPRRRS